MLLTTILKSAAILLAIREKFDEPDKNLDAYIVPQSGQHYVSQKIFQHLP